MTWMGDDDAHMDGHAGHGTAGHDSAGAGSGPMPGMATSEELAALRAASGPELDVLFLQLMLRHHEGGLPMMEYGAEHARWLPCGRWRRRWWTRRPPSRS